MAKRKRENGTSVSKNAKRKNGETKPGKKLIINAFVEMCKFIVDFWNGEFMKILYSAKTRVHVDGRAVAKQIDR
jgi:hypothetical protein